MPTTKMAVRNSVQEISESIVFLFFCSKTNVAHIAPGFSHSDTEYGKKKVQTATIGSLHFHHSYQLLTKPPEKKGNVVNISPCLLVPDTFIAIIHPFYQASSYFVDVMCPAFLSYSQFLKSPVIVSEIDVERCFKK